MAALNLVVTFGGETVRWDGSEMSIDRGDRTEHVENACGLMKLSDSEEDELNAGEESRVKPADLVPEHLKTALMHCYLILLEAHYALYSGRLGRIPLDDYISPQSVDYVPSHAKPYSVPRIQEDLARREIQLFLSMDVLEQIYDSESAAPAFFLRKLSGELRLFVDFRNLNKFLRRSPYFVPKICEILLKLGKAICLSTLDC
ncbi:Pol Polyprotein [Phytophthora megakarya]|uniref:Pol Polyprotein n=1 Tax=Phytophthora megakarya TaxID=4795 RepID=A0A225W6A7_9STRA|nr:Pol Polyprotein [Phytophthora megakarya]